MPAPSARDPRDLITTEAFEVDPALLGLPLAPPSKRLFAMLIDLAVIGAITLLTRSFALLLGVVAAVFFIRMSFKQVDVPGSVFGRAMRGSLGCLGVLIGIVTAIIWTSIGFGGRDGPDFTTNLSIDGTPASFSGMSGLSQLLGGLADVGALRGAQDATEARVAATRLANIGVTGGVPLKELEEALIEMIPADAPWADQSLEIVASAIEDAQRGAAGSGVASADSTPRTDPLERLSLSLDSATAALVADTVSALQARLEAADRLATRRATELADAESALEQERGGIFSWLRNIVDELGFGFGWASLYLTVILSAWKGQTVGKRMMRIRVLRLDGQPITWWTAFERAGGYAAGFATGLLGFAQVYWDANRQTIHDRIVGTVVVIDGADKVPGWEGDETPPPAPKPVRPRPPPPSHPASQ